MYLAPAWFSLIGEHGTGARPSLVITAFIPFGRAAPPLNQDKAFHIIVCWRTAFQQTISSRWYKFSAANQTGSRSDGWL